MQDKTPRNEKRQPHGYWEVYHDNGNLDWKGLYINGAKFGKHEWFNIDGSGFYIINYINNIQHGYYEFNWKNGRIDKIYYAR